MKKNLLSIVKFFNLVLLTFSFSLASANEKPFNNLVNNSKKGRELISSPVSIKPVAAHKYREEGIFGKALAFDGNNDFLEINGGLAPAVNQWTMEMWVFLPTPTPTPTPTPQFTVVGGQW